MTRGKIIIVQGGQYGSEGKGAVAAELAWRRGVSAAVRTGSINAGHTVYHKGLKHVMQILPTAWVNPSMRLFLGAGCYIEPSILAREIDDINMALGVDICERIVIDHRCVIFGEEELSRAQAAGRHHAMGATGKGASEAIISKMNDRGRGDPQARIFKHQWQNHHQLRDKRLQFGDTVLLLDQMLNRGESILLEGTQGALLDFNTGPYPYVTSRMTNAAAWLAEAGLPPENVETALVVRSHPIRVAGNSGPMPREVSWASLTETVNRKLDARGMTAVVPQAAIDLFNKKLTEIVRDYFPEVMVDVTITEDRKTSFHLWDENQKLRHRVCVSEANAATFRALSPEIVDLLRFWEKTTVTKKLRRIAMLDFDAVTEAIRMNRPRFLVYTFLNYDFPHLAGCTTAQALEEPEVKAHLEAIERKLGVPIFYVTTGPLPQHHIETRHAQYN